MAAATKSAPIDSAAALWQVKKAVALNKGGDPVAALEVARDAAKMFPTFRFPAAEGKLASFAELVETLQVRVDMAKAAATKVPAAKAAAVKAPVAKAAPVQKAQPETVTLTVVHDGVKPTSIYGVQPGMDAVRILGKRSGGLGWAFDRTTGSNAWYLPRTGGFAPDMDRIEAAASALLAAVGEDGTQLYRIVSEIRTTDAAGAALPTKESAETLAAWQREYTGADNLAKFKLGMGQGECATCGRSALTVVDGRITKDARKIPQVQCATCCGEAVEDLGLGDLLALPSAPTVVVRPEARECPACRQLVEVVGGKLKMHSKPIVGGFCPGKAAAVDVEPEAAPVKAARKAPVAKAPAKVAPVAAREVFDTAEHVAAQVRAAEAVKAATVALTAAMTNGSGLLEAARALEVANEAERVTRLMVAEARARRQAPPVAADDAEGLSLTFRTIAGTSGMQLKESATQFRSDLARAMAMTGVKVEVRKDKATKTLVAVVVDAPADVDVAALTKTIRTMGLAQRGVIGASRA